MHGRPAQALAGEDVKAVQGACAHPHQNLAGARLWGGDLFQLNGIEAAITTDYRRPHRALPHGPDAAARRSVRRSLAR